MYKQRDGAVNEQQCHNGINAFGVAVEQQAECGTKRRPAQRKDKADKGKQQRE